ncbi:translation initiation factor IF-2-like [Passer montanus]|uniref:translation initiation factor IF-2-like n=1 Tax=Passer montanus TaxID=9160 RepID=UPI0019605E48|nr:translation initiation factor IF-2-like [Passer montanus]
MNAVKSVPDTAIARKETDPCSSLPAAHTQPPPPAGTEAPTERRCSPESRLPAATGAPGTLQPRRFPRTAISPFCRDLPSPSHSPARGSPTSAWDKPRPRPGGCEGPREGAEHSSGRPATPPCRAAGAPRGADGGRGRGSAARPSREGKRGPSMPALAQGPGGRTGRYPETEGASRRSPPEHPSKAPPRGSLTNRVRGGAGIIDLRWIDRSLSQCSRSRSVSSTRKAEPQLGCWAGQVSLYLSAIGCKC